MLLNSFCTRRLKESVLDVLSWLGKFVVVLCAWIMGESESLHPGYMLTTFGTYAGSDRAHYSNVTQYFLEILYWKMHSSVFPEDYICISNHEACISHECPPAEGYLYPNIFMYTYYLNKKTETILFLILVTSQPLMVY